MIFLLRIIFSLLNILYNWKEMCKLYNSSEVLNIIFHLICLILPHYCVWPFLGIKYRLVTEETNSDHGRVEIGLNGQWNAICGTDWDNDDATNISFNLFNPATLLCLSQARTWISNIICRVQWVKGRGDCSFSWYWWIVTITV
jgi:hypothetical protein